MDSLYIAGVILTILVLAALFEYRIRKPDHLILSDQQGKIRLRRNLFFPRHFSLALKKEIHPVHFDSEVSAAGNIGVRIRLVGSAAPAMDHLTALIRVGGWREDAVARAAEEAQVFLEGTARQYAENLEIQNLSSSGMVEHLLDQAAVLQEKFGLELISLSIKTLEPTDPQIAAALRQQEQARIHEETERLSQQARTAAAKAQYETDQEIAQMEHALELKRLELDQLRFQEEAALARKKLENELEQNRLRLAFEKEEVEVLTNSPELLMLTPQAARLAEASQNLKNARTVIALSPQELSQGAELVKLFQELLKRMLEKK